MENKKKKNGVKAWFPLLLSIMMGVLLGVATTRYADASAMEGESVFMRLLITFGILLAVIYIQTVIHELGHLVFGLLSGYRFSSFRIFSILLKKEQGKLRIKRLKLAGTGG
ncbi:MAG: hypothetical protein IJC85_06330, partial [Oscillospiraceae bacterium]|nr:hypothetical protein [Oscillospiraceae bacterium]